MSPKMTIRLTNYVLILITMGLSAIRCSEDTSVPVLIWSTHRYASNSFGWTPRSSVARIDANLLREDYLNKSQTIIAFIQKHLSVEQFSNEDNNRFNTLNHLINDQTLEPIFLSDVLSPNEALKDFSVQDLNSLNINDGNKIVINLPKDNLVENDGLIGELWHQISQNISFDAIFLLTGHQNSQLKQLNDKVVVNHRLRRQASDKRRAKSSKGDDIKRLVNIDDCLYFYTRSVAIHMKTANNTSVHLATFDSLGQKPSEGSSRCWKNKGEDPALLDLTYQKTDATLTIKFRIGSDRSGFWQLRESTVTFIDNKGSPITQELDVSDVNAEKLFSYSCSRQVIRSKAEDSNKQIVLTFDRFQIQPFRNQKNRDKKQKIDYIFADSFDCEPWMTLGLWMGLLTLILMTIILCFGVYALSRVSSPDRFENPKGKPLIVTNADE